MTGGSGERLRIALITGGSTPERDVALAGAGEVLRALRVAGHEVTAVDTVHGALGPEQEGQFLALRVGRKPPADEELALARDREDVPGLLRLKPVSEADLAFLVLHGLDGEGGLLQAVLAARRPSLHRQRGPGERPGNGEGLGQAGPAGAGIPTPRFEMLEFQTPEDRRDEIEALGARVVVKPSRVGSSVGLRVAHDFDDICSAVAEARWHDRCVLVEEMLPGREFTVGVVGEPDGAGLEPLGVGEIVTGSGLFDYHAKYTPGVAEEIFPADIPESLARELRELTVKTHRALGLRDFSRVDFRLDAHGDPFVLEANTLPGMTTRSLLPQSAAVMGIGFPALCDRIARLAASRRE